MKTRLFFAALLLLAFGTMKAQNEADQINIIRVLGSGDVCVGQMTIERIAQNLLEMSETLLVTDDLDVVGLAEVFQFLDFLGGESVGGRNVRVALGLEGVLGIERERVEFTLCQLRNDAFQVVHADDGTVEGRREALFHDLV